MRKTTVLFAFLSLFAGACTLNGAYTDEPTKSPESSSSSASPKDSLEQVIPDDDDYTPRDSSINAGGGDDGASLPGLGDVGITFTIGEELYNDEYDDGILLSDGQWEYLDRQSGVSVYELELLPSRPTAVYFKDIPQARIVQGWETVIAFTKDADGNFLGSYAGNGDELVTAFWTLPKNSATLYVQTYNLFVSEESGTVYRAVPHLQVPNPKQ